MKHLAVILLCALAAAGCTTKANSRQQAAQAWQAGQKAAQQQTAAASGITVLGAVQNPQVPWVEGLTLTQAIATANYTGPRDPKEIIITRQGESATLSVKDVLRGAVIPLERGDVIELR